MRETIPAYIFLNLSGFRTIFSASFSRDCSSLKLYLKQNLKNPLAAKKITKDVRQNLFKIIKSPEKNTNEYPNNFGTNLHLRQLYSHHYYIICKLEPTTLSFVTLNYQKHDFEPYRRRPVTSPLPGNSPKHRLLRRKPIPICGLDYQPAPIIPPNLRARALKSKHNPNQPKNTK